MSTSTVRVVVVEDHPVTRMGVVALLGHDERIDVVGEAGTGEDALEVVAGERPDVVVTDLRLGAPRSDVLAQHVGLRLGEGALAAGGGGGTQRRTRAAFAGTGRRRLVLQFEGGHGDRRPESGLQEADWTTPAPCRCPKG